MKGITNPEIIKQNKKNFKSIKNFVQYFPIYTNLLSDLLKILLMEDEMRNDQIESEVLSRYKKGFYFKYYQFLINACKEEIQEYLKFFTNMTNEEIQSLFKNDKSKNDKSKNDKSKNDIYINNLDIVDTNSNNKYSTIIAFPFSQRNIKNKKLLMNSRIEENKIQSQDPETIIERLLKNLINLYKNDIPMISLNSFIDDNYIGEYIEFYPCIDKFKNQIIDYLMYHGLYDSEEKILNNMKDKLPPDELRIFQYYIICCKGFKNILLNFNDFDVHDFHKVNFYKYKGLLFEKDFKEITLDNKDNNEKSEIDTEIIQTVKSMLPTDEEKQKLNEFYNKVSNIILNEWPKSNLSIHLFGSTVNGLWSHTSDVDLCIFADKEGEYNDMRKLAQVLRKAGMVDVIPINGARMPICKFRDQDTKFNCDLSVNNRIPIYNSELIRCYMDLDERVRDIVMIIKKWSKIRGINNSKERTFCSYSYVLLCISFFQHINPPVLPNLQKINRFPGLKMVTKNVDISRRLLDIHSHGTFKIKIQYYNDANEVAKHFITENKMSRMELLMKLFQFYGYQFDLTTKTLASSIKHDGGFLIRDSYYFSNNSRDFDNKEFSKSRDFMNRHSSMNTEFAVEDPFIHGRNTTSNSTMEEKIHIKNEFFRAYHLLKNPYTSSIKLKSIFE
ncbi:hypothetical protein LY90DRAFT_500394 [Neocallimastix californiae]|uniref:Poly(A) RNA polymerase mitochondrial-like central palm domain-containing protein n=1 Tax=Neocallimastix californiae TaxID=1754190 RepID=A0A1Y2F9Q8_9FUNG|nr:hypothetical protein LY90DRAFT_500394 [Neocallimastix californiae]|eukprot:ORY80613.1 hypothetical protein LY90DRAFT_500394 [Neocallimastix californiae]